MTGVVPGVPSGYVEELTIATPDHRLAATRVLPDGGGRPHILTLHGLGATATRHSVRYLLDALARDGHASLCFEFSGNGDSSGTLALSSLRRRRDELLAAAATLDPARAPILIGTSMGGHLAAWSVPVLRPRGLVLFCPAAYPAHATDLAFGDGFTRPGAYPDSPAFAGIRQFDGDLLIVAGREDRVVPADVIDAYVDNARGARSCQVVWLDDCDHFIHRMLPGHETARATVIDAVRRLVAADRMPAGQEA